MNHEPAIRVLLDYASKSRQAVSRSSDAGFPVNAAGSRDLADIYDAIADLLRGSNHAVDSGDAHSARGGSSTRETVGSYRCKDSFLSSLGGILG